MMPETDIYGMANLLISEYRERALLLATERLERYRRLGNNNEIDKWRRICNAIDALQMLPHLKTQTSH